ncbi:MAG TPA: UDP-N-acetylmuramoyl-L-alanyl-D-glutamate--2,6-diaminopimelate ligase [Dehalococcoidia bacterium]
MDLTAAYPGARLIGDLPSLSGLTHDSRMTGPGLAFIAVPGKAVDGHDFVRRAVAAGAPLVVVQADRREKWQPFAGQTALLVVDDTRRAMGPLAAAVHGKPSHKLRTIGVTGTDGKSTTCHVVGHVLSACGMACGYLTSVGFDTGHGFEENELHMTTLEATDIQARLAEALSRGEGAMCVEASSEGLAQHRVDGCEIDVAVFRNLSRDHLDFHGTMAAYRDAKGLLFEMLDVDNAKPFPKAAIVNADDPASAHMLGRTKVAALTYGIEQAADVRGSDIRGGGLTIRFVVEARAERVQAVTPLMIAYNPLAAIAVALSQGIGLSDAAASLESFPGVPGRLQLIDCGQPFRVVVDIASTPAALEFVLKTLRTATKGRLWVVFGAAGGRDPARRDGLGAVAARFADRAVLTNEDPRHEDPDAIIEAIAAAMRAAGKVEGRDFEKVPDRRSAIAHAFAHAALGDTVLLAGKATEAFMVFGDEHVPWDEPALARELLTGTRRS